MLHHVSFNAHNPQLVAHVLAEMLGVKAIRAAAPPFPDGTWFVVYGDAQGSLIEVLPWNSVLDPDAPGGSRDDLAMRERTGNHVLLRTHRTIEAIVSIAAIHGWRATLTDAGFFKFIKVWVEDTFLVEMMTPEQATEYIATFGSEGLATLDGKLRELEAALAVRLA
jgi:hypothetical protein